MIPSAGDELTAIYRGIVQWGVPVILLAAIHYLQQISSQLYKISESLAVVVVKIEHHEKVLFSHSSRIDRLEKKEQDLRR